MRPPIHKHMLDTISPLEGRYREQVAELLPIFSEEGLIRKRLEIEIEYLIALSAWAKLPELPKLSAVQIKKLRALYKNFSSKDADEVKKIEKTTDHDVKALEYFVKSKLKKMRLQELAEFYHFALTSEDINNIAYSMQLREGVEIYVKTVDKLLKEVRQLAIENKSVPMMGMTHGQPATPTTVGKELAVFYSRLKDRFEIFRKLKLSAKFSGASGNWNAHSVAYPNIDWIRFSKKFVERFGFDFIPFSTQIEPHDRTAGICRGIIGINNIIKNLDIDLWLYISRGIFGLRKSAREIGSSTMPHKVNPIKFENSEGNIGIANSLLWFLSEKLPVSRLQRDLTDSTVIRNQGVALGYSLLAIKNTIKGLLRLSVNKQQCLAELDQHWEVLAEPIQTVLRKAGVAQPYEKLKKLTRGHKVDKELLHSFIKGLKIKEEEKNLLLRLTPQTYIGLASKLVSEFLK